MGFLKEPAQDRHPICVVPDDCAYQPEVFKGVLEAAIHFERSDPAAKTFHTHPKAHENDLRRINRRAHWKAILQAVKGATRSGEWIPFLSGSVELEGYVISVVLQLQTSIYESYYRLQKEISRAPYTYECGVERSFLDAVADEFLRATVQCLTVPHPGESFQNIEQQGPLMQAAARQLMYTPAAAGESPSGLHGLYDACNTISTLKYEGQEGVGKLVIARQNHPDVQVQVGLTRPVSITDYGAVRKLLQMASGQLSLLSDSWEVYGLGTTLESYNPTREDVFVIEFIRHFVWQLTHAGQPLLLLRYGEPRIRQPDFPQETFTDIVTRTFPNLGKDLARILCHMAKHLGEMQHGGMLVISANAEKEAERLATQSTPVKPFPLDHKLLSFVSSIDGAVLVDLRGMCHAIGVILDGTASPKCTPSRGARFNSAIRYVYGRSDAVAVVKSEDGMMDVLPDLMPRIHRSVLKRQLEDLRRVANQEIVEPGELYEVREWLREHRFYLSKEVCDEVNALIKQALDRYPRGTMKVIDPDFTPDEDMNDKYFFQEPVNP